LKKSIAILTTFLLLFFANPVLAQVYFDVNGRYFTPDSEVITRNNMVLVPADMIVKTLGAELTVDEGQICIRENDQTLQMTVGNRQARLNDQDLTMPVAPEMLDDQVWLPLRFVFETLGAKVKWSNYDQRITITYEETRNGLSAVEMLAKSSKLLQDSNSYKMEVDTNNNIHMLGPSDNNSEKLQEIIAKMTGYVDAYIQYQPLLMHMIQDMDIIMSDNPDFPKDITQSVRTEMVCNNNGMYMTIPQQGWVKLTIPGVDMQELMNQSMNQDPLTSVNMINDLSMAVAYANDIEKGGEKYWVIDVTLGNNAIQMYMQQIQQIESVFELPGDNQAILDLFKNLDFDIKYRILINQKNTHTEYMDVYGNYFLTMEVPVEEDEITDKDIDIPEKEPNTVNINMGADIEASYTLSDFGVKFEVPDVSEAKTMEEIMKEQTNSTVIENTEEL